jgi:glycosyl transferase family 25
MNNYILLIGFFIIITGLFYFLYHYNTSDGNIGDIHFIIGPEQNRIDNINKQIKLLNLKNTNIFDAIMGKNLGDTEIQYYIDNNYINQDSLNVLNPGQIGCILSHLTIIEEFVKSNKPYITILEDDVILTRDFKQKYKEYINELPEDYEIAYLYLSELTRSCSKKKEFELPNKNIVIKGFPQYGTVGYRLSKKGAMRLLSLLKPCDWTIDNIILFHVRTGNIKSYCPKSTIIEHSNFPSTIPKNFSQSKHLQKYISIQQYKRNRRKRDIKKFHKDLLKCK